jgi:gliding motility-associated-like protein
MKKTILLLKLICLIVVNISTSTTSKAQTDTLFWFVAPESGDGGGNFDIPIVFRFSSLSTASQIVVDIPANSSFTPISLNINANSTITLDLSTHINLVENRPPDQILNKGLRIRATNPITAYYEVVSSYCNCNPEIFALKGHKALGTKFYTPFQDTFKNGGRWTYSPLPFSAIDVVATEDNTDVTITPTKDVVGHAAGIPFTIKLNKGQSYSATATSPLGVNHLGGSKVESNKPIAVTIKDDKIGYGDCADLAGDQLIPIDYLGDEYVVMKGFLSIPDRVHILAIENNTQVFLNGTLITTINEGQYYVHRLSNSSVYIKTSKNVYVMHLSGFGCEMGMAILPPITCTGSRQVGFTRSRNDPFYLLIMVEDGGQANFTLNGNASYIASTDFNDVPGTSGQWKFMSKLFDTSKIKTNQASSLINSTHHFHMGMIHGTAANGTRYGYFSDYGSYFVKTRAESNFLCVGDTLKLFGQSLDTSSGTWAGPNGFFSNDLNPIIPNVTFSDEGYYYFSSAINQCGFNYDSVYITVKSIPQTPEISSNSPVCLGDTFRIEVKNKPDPDLITIWFNANFDSVYTGDNYIIYPSSFNDSGKYYAGYKYPNSYCISNLAETKVNVYNNFSDPLTSNKSSYCEGDTLFLFAQKLDSNTFFWTGPNGFYSSEQNPIIPNITIANQGYYLFSTTVPLCGSGYDSIYISVSPNVAVSKPDLISNAPVCVGDTLRIEVTNKTNPDLMTIWYNSDLDSIYTGDIYVIYPATQNDSGRYNVIFKYTNSSCVSQNAYIDALIFPLTNKPVLETNIINNKFCENEQAIITNIASSNPTDIYNWTGPNGFTSSSFGQITINSLQSQNSGFYKLTINRTDACESLDSIFIEVLFLPNANNVNFSSNSPICSGDDLFLYTTGVEPDVEFSWKGPLNFKKTNESPAMISKITSNHAGRYYLTFKKGACVADSALFIDVDIFQSPIADFTFVSEYFELNIERSFTNQSQFAKTYLWDFGDLSPTVKNANPRHTYTEVGIFPVMLIAYSDNQACADTMIKEIMVIPEKDKEFFAPGSFSPNGDGLNEIFIITGVGIYDVTFEIYDRWGELLFISHDGTKIGWDGTYRGNPVPEGIYVYIVSYKNIQSHNRNGKGTFHLMR